MIWFDWHVVLIGICVFGRAWFFNWFIDSEGVMRFILSWFVPTTRSQFLTQGKTRYTTNVSAMMILQYAIWHLVTYGIALLVNAMSPARQGHYMLRETRLKNHYSPKNARARRNAAASRFDLRSTLCKNRSTWPMQLNSWTQPPAAAALPLMWTQPTSPGNTALTSSFQTRTRFYWFFQKRYREARECRDMWNPLLCFDRERGKTSLTTRPWQQQGAPPLEVARSYASIFMNSQRLRSATRCLASLRSAAFRLRSAARTL